MLKTSEEFLKEINENDLFVLIKKTFFKGEFIICPVDDEVASDEVCLGTLNDLEKAIFLAALSIPEKHLKYHTAVGDRFNHHLCFLSRIQEETLLNLLWATIYARLQDKALKFSSLGVRKNWQIVGFCDDNPGFFEDEVPFSFGTHLS